MKDSVLITGAGGFLGSHLAVYFSDRGHQVAGIDQFPPGIRDIQMHRAREKLYRLKLPDSELINILRDVKPHLVIHCAGTASVPLSLSDPYEDFQENVGNTVFILDCLRQGSPDSTFIFLSSAAVYGNPITLPIEENAPCAPISPYGKHKYMCEMLIQEFSEIYGISSAIVRIFSAYGEGLQRQVVYDLCRKFTNPQSTVIEVYGTGQESRDFIHASDVARAVECLYASQATGVFNCASGEKTSIIELVGLVKKSLNSTKDVSYTGAVRAGDPLFWQADISKLNSCGFEQIVPLSEGIANYCQWFLRTPEGEQYDSHYSCGPVIGWD